MKRVRAVTVVVAVALTSAACGSGKEPAQPRPFPQPSAAPSASAPASPVSPLPPPAVSPPAPVAQTILDGARAQLGVPYRLGGDRPATGFDCSGLVRYVFQALHVDLPRTVGEQFGRGIKIAIQDVRAGDLVFFSTTGPGPTHVGIALGNGGFIHAPSSNGVVRVDRYDAPYWHDRLVGARRMF